MIFLFERDSQKELEGRLLEAVTKRTGTDFSPHKNHHKIIFFDNKNDFYGGAFIKEAQFKDIFPSDLAPMGDRPCHIFHGFFFHEGEDESDRRKYSFEYYYQLFFRRVYQQAYHLVQRQKMDPLFLHITQEMMDDIHTFGQWPSKWQMRLDHDIFMCLDVNEDFSRRCDAPLDPLCPDEILKKAPLFLNDLQFQL